MTVPYNEHTGAFVDGFFNQTDYTASITMDDSSGTNVVFTMPNFCVTGDGGLPDIPEGEITLPISFGAYAATEVSGTNTVFADSNPAASEAPIVVSIDVSP